VVNAKPISILCRQDSMRQENKNKFRELCAKAGITQKKAAELISAKIYPRSCSVRAVRSWLANDSAPSRRDCPDWAILALEEMTSNTPRDEGWS
jgi:predicted transcriptional regulator